MDNILAWFRLDISDSESKKRNRKKKERKKERKEIRTILNVQVVRDDHSNESI